jgi:hypothetical protein
MTEEEKERIRRELETAADEAVQLTDQQLEDKLSAIKNAAIIDLEALKPQVTDTEVYDKLDRGC